MVTGLECGCGLCDAAEHVGFLQGEMLSPHRFAFTVYRYPLEERTVGIFKSYSMI